MATGGSHGGTNAIVETKGDFDLFWTSGFKGEEWGKRTVLFWKDKQSDEYKKVENEPKGRHAELLLIDILKKTETRDLKLLINYSPCADCANALVAFLKERNITIDIHCASIYYSDKPKYKEGLFSLHSLPGSTIQTFNNDTWKELAAMTGYTGLNEKKYTKENKQKHTRKKDRRNSEKRIR